MNVSTAMNHPLSPSLKDEGELPCVSKATLHRILKNLGFNFMKCQRDARLIRAPTVFSGYASTCP